MPQLPEAVRDAWEKRSGPAILATVGDESTPNAIYVTCVALYDDCTVLIADNYFDKTRRNILAGSKGAFLFMTEDHKTYQIKGTIARHTDGPIFDHMKSWNPEKHPGHAAAALAVEEVYSGAEKLL
jgi:predicted pyridoxine 5'-phosphate oxidase superfamily flavin-nucleotide-binding protein